MAAVIADACGHDKLVLAGWCVAALVVALAGVEAPVPLGAWAAGELEPQAPSSDALAAANSQAQGRERSIGASFTAHRGRHAGGRTAQSARRLEA
jgi:hypothetical protein